MDRKKLPRGVFETSPGSNRFGIRITDEYGDRPERVIGSLANAEKAAKEARNERRCSKVLAPKKPNPSFNEIADLAIVYGEEHQADPTKMESQLTYFCESVCDPDSGMTFGDRIAEEISQAEIETWLNVKAKERDWSDKEWSVKTKGDYRTAIRIAYREAMRLGLLEVDPTDQIKLKREIDKVVRVLTLEELDVFRASIAIPGDHARTAKFCHDCLAQLEIALQTGMRRSEQFSATWEKIDWARHVLFIPKGKNTHPRDVYLNSYALAILRALQAEQSRDGIAPRGRIFRIDNPRAWFERTLAHANIKGVTWKTLRHQFATDLAKAGVPFKHIQELMGHLDPRSTVRYIHRSNDDAKVAINSIANTSTPEYLHNKAYIDAIVDDDAHSTLALKARLHTITENLVQDTPADLPVLEPELRPRGLASIAREALYNLVWSQPVMRVAKLLGRSDVAVAKACRRRNIPIPGRGRWAKIAAGKPVPPRPPLPPT